MQKNEKFNLYKCGKSPLNAKAREVKVLRMRSSPSESEGQNLTLFKRGLDPAKFVTKSHGLCKHKPQLEKLKTWLAPMDACQPFLATLKSLTGISNSFRISYIQTRYATLPNLIFCT